jgi:hypothetical protein
VIGKMEAKGSNWKEVGDVELFVKSNIKLRVNQIQRTLDDRFLRPCSELRYNIFHEVSL